MPFHTLAPIPGFTHLSKALVITIYRMSEESRNKTQKNLDLGGAVALGFSEKNFQMLSEDAGNALKRPWHKLERGLRIGRLREYVARETERVKLNAEDSDFLFKLLCKGLDRKLLSSKAAVTYDHALEQITEIKGLVAQHSAATARTKYQLLEKKSGTTQKKRGNKDTPTLSSNGDGLAQSSTSE
jgi:hypothetical protein